MSLVLTHARSELELTGMAPTPLGISILQFIETLSETSTDAVFIQNITELINRAFSLKPLSPITENDFTTEADANGHVRCDRYTPVYKNIKTGKYYDEHACCYPISNGSKMHVPGMSPTATTREISLPYIPPLYEEELFHVSYNLNQDRSLR